MIGCKTHQKRNWLKVQESFTQSRVRVGTRPKNGKATEITRPNATAQRHRPCGLVRGRGLVISGIECQNKNLNQQDNYLHEHSLQQGPLASKYSMSRGKPNGKAQPHFNYLWPGHIFPIMQEALHFRGLEQERNPIGGSGAANCGVQCYKVSWPQL